MSGSWRRWFGVVALAVALLAGSGQARLLAIEAGQKSDSLTFDHLIDLLACAKVTDSSSCVDRLGNGHLVWADSGRVFYRWGWNGVDSTGKPNPPSAWTGRTVLSRWGTCSSPVVIERQAGTDGPVLACLWREENEWGVRVMFRLHYPDEMPFLWSNALSLRETSR